MRTNQPAKVKILSYQLQKYGMVDGAVTHIGADASEAKQDGETKDKAAPAKYRGKITLNAILQRITGEN